VDVPVAGGAGDVELGRCGWVTCRDLWVRIAKERAADGGKRGVAVGSLLRWE
jgi:hypothetical protein